MRESWDVGIENNLEKQFDNFFEHKFLGTSETIEDLESCMEKRLTNYVSYEISLNFNPF
jgi:hypothetical protein